ncbi:hypothetical protein [Patulibacter sp. SYSU D01012]|uniref:hypothetical protein n=1 Tax=Patulibacter sp. SYSU D01012 TaxID=2817381 RepID=UPI001B3172D3|nr:hypothetical protein [Patulibacter sp. SYSU D01012]
MFPLKDALPGDRSWVSVVLPLLALAAAVRPLPALLAAVVLFVAADGVARRVRPSAAVALAVVGAVAGVALTLGPADADATWRAIGPAAAIGAAAAVAAGHLLRAPGARVLTFSLVPAFGGMVAVPAVLWALVGAALAVLVV